MSATPIAADHSEEFEQLAGLHALRVLEGDELLRFERHAEQCERCRMIVRLDQEALGGLALAAPPMDPSPGFKDRLLTAARAELDAAAQPAPEPIPLRPRGRILQFPRQAWLSAIAAVLVIGFATTFTLSYMNQVVASYALSGSAAGDAQVVVRRNGSVELQMHGVADPPAGSVYEAWIIPPGQQPIAAGVAPRGDASLPLNGSARGSTVAITLERGPQGTTTPTLPILMAGTVAS